MPPRLAVPVMLRLARFSAVLPSTVLLLTARSLPPPSTAPVTETVLEPAFSVTCVVRFRVSW